MEYGEREDRREDLECIMNRDVTDAELDEFIQYGTTPPESTYGAIDTHTKGAE